MSGVAADNQAVTSSHFFPACPGPRCRGGKENKDHEIKKEEQINELNVNIQLKNNALWDYRGKYITLSDFKTQQLLLDTVNNAYIMVIAL